MAVKILKKILKEGVKKAKKAKKSKGDKAADKAIAAERKKDPSFDDKVSYYNYLTIEKNMTNAGEIAKKMQSFVPGKPTKMQGGGIALKGHGRAFLKGNR